MISERKSFPGDYVQPGHFKMIRIFRIRIRILRHC